MQRPSRGRCRQPLDRLGRSVSDAFAESDSGSLLRRLGEPLHFGEELSALAFQCSGDSRVDHLPTISEGQMDRKGNLAGAR